MTRMELTTRINELTKTANSLDEPDKTFTLNEIDKMAIEIEGMALEELCRRLEQIQLPELREIDEQIAAAEDATKAHQSRVEALNIGIGILRTVIGIMV
jgi:uncharacterized protein YdgA (DUF945 family)